MQLKKESINKFLIIMVIMMGSKGNYYVLSDVMLILAFLISFFTYIEYNKFEKIHRSFVVLTLIYVLVNIYYLLEFSYIEFFSTVKTFLKIAIGYFVAAQLQTQLFHLYEKYIVRFTLITFPFYALQLISPEVLKAIIKPVESLFPGLNVHGEKVTNIFFFTLNEKGGVDELYRNSGFAWEPKGFANMLIIALIINLFRSKFVPNKWTLILLVGLISTFSTTAYVVGFMTIGALFLLNAQNLKRKILITSVFVIGGIYVVSLPFVYDKVEEEINATDKIENYLNETRDLERRSMGRFGSLAMDWNDFKERPLFGVGMQEYERTQNKYTFLVRVNGLSDLMSRFGLLGICFFLYTYYHFSSALVDHFNTKGKYLVLLSIIMIMFASALIINPLWLSFQGLALTYQKRNAHW